MSVSDLKASKYGLTNMRSKRPNLPPLYFEEALSPKYRVDFRRFLLKQKSVQPLQFIEMVSEMMKIKDAEVQRRKAEYIWKKFFRNKNENLLQCSAKIIILLTASECVTPEFLAAACPVVSESLEENWFKIYEESFYSESEYYMKTQVMQFRCSHHKERQKRSNVYKVLWKIFLFVADIRIFKVTNLLVSYITCLYEEQLLDIAEIKEEKMNRKKSSHMCPRLDYLMLSEYGILISKTKFLRDSIRYKELFQMFKVSGRLHKEKQLLKRKARYIIMEYLQTEKNSPSSSQLNISSTLLTETLMKFKREGISSGLFHNITIDIFPAVYKVWSILMLEQRLHGGRNYIRTKLNARLKAIQFDKCK